MNKNTYHNIVLRAIVMEQLLRIDKTQIYHEDKLVLEAELEKCKDITPTKVRVNKEKKIKEKIERYKKSIKRAEKNNSELTDYYHLVNPNINTKSFIDNIHDLYAIFTTLVFRSLTGIGEKKNKKNIFPAVLELLEKGDKKERGANYVTIDGNKYKVYTV